MQRTPSNPSGSASLPVSVGPRSGLINAATRSRSLHWLAWAGAVVSLIVAGLWMWGSFSPLITRTLQAIDVGLALFFVVEFFTRTGWQRSRLSYLKWRWFDVVALVPVTVLGPVAVAPLVWIVLICRSIRLVDRTLGDGFVQRKVVMLLGLVSEELSDRVLVKMLARWEREVEHANFGSAMARALARNKANVLARVYAEQLQEGAFSKFAHFTGLQAALEREEERLFGALIEMVGSREVDEALRDVVASSLRRSRERLGAKDWRRTVDAPTSSVRGEPLLASGAARAGPVHLRASSRERVGPVGHGVGHGVRAQPGADARGRFGPEFPRGSLKRPTSVGRM